MAVPDEDSGDWVDDIASLYLLEEAFLPPMPTLLPSVRAERDRIYRESGEITRELIARLLAGEFR